MKNKIKKIFIFFVFSIIGFTSVYAKNIDNTNVWDNDAVSNDLIYPTAWNEVCGGNKDMTSSISAEEWNTCSGDNKISGEFISFSDWSALVGMIRMTFGKAEFGKISFGEAGFENNAGVQTPIIFNSDISLLPSFGEISL